MADDGASERSLSARVRALEDILDGMDDRLQRNQAQLEELAPRVRDAATAEVILARAMAGSAPGRRDRHGMHMVPPLAVLAPAWAALRWALRLRVHQAVTAGAALALAGGVMVAPATAAAGAGEGHSPLAAVHRAQPHQPREPVPGRAAAAPVARRPDGARYSRTGPHRRHGGQRGREGE